MQTPALFFVDENATFHIAVCRLLIRFFSNRCAENTTLHPIKYPFHFTFLQNFLFLAIAQRGVFDTTTFHVSADSNQFCLSGTGQLNFPTLSPSQPHLCIFGRQTNLCSCYCALRASEVERVSSFDYTRPVALLSALLSIYPTCLSNIVFFFSVRLAWIVLHSWLRFSEPCSTQCVWSWFFLEYMRETRRWMQRVLEKWIGFLKKFQKITSRVIYVIIS